MSLWYSCMPKTSGTTITVAYLPAFFGAAKYTGRLPPPETGTWAAPTSKLSAGVMIAVCATTGPAASAKLVARLEAIKPRRVNGTLGKRLSRWGSSNWARSFILPPFLGVRESAAVNRYSRSFIPPWLVSAVGILAASRKHAHQPQREGREDGGRPDQSVAAHPLLSACGFGAFLGHQLRHSFDQVGLSRRARLL